MHSTEKLLTTSVLDWQGINYFRITCTLCPLTFTTIKNIMVDSLHDYSLFWVAFEDNRVPNDILCTNSYRFAKSLFRPPKPRINWCLFFTCGVGRIYQTNRKFKATLNIVFLINAVFLQGLSRSTSITFCYQKEIYLFIYYQWNILRSLSQ